MGLELHVNLSGPIADLTAPAIIDRYASHLRHVMADEVEDRVKLHLMGVLRHDRGVYIEWTHQEDLPDRINVTDRWIVYGPWLEGVGSRVGPVGTGKWPMTRFPGYHTYRIVTQEYNLVAEDRAYQELPPFLLELNA